MPRLLQLQAGAGAGDRGSPELRPGRCPLLKTLLLVTIFSLSLFPLEWNIGEVSPVRNRLALPPTRSLAPLLDKDETAALPVPPQVSAKFKGGKTRSLFQWHFKPALPLPILSFPLNHTSQKYEMRSAAPRGASALAGVPAPGASRQSCPGQ